MSPKPPSRGSLLLVVVVALLAGCGSRADRVETGLKRGADLLTQGDLEKAGVEIRNVLQIDPRNARALLVAAQLSEAENDMRKAFAQYQKAAELDPGLVDARAGIARLYLVTGDFARAKEAIEAVLAADPQHSRGRTLQAGWLAAQGRPDEAMSLARQVLADDPAAPTDASFVLSGMLLRKGDTIEALSVIDRALQRRPNDLGLLRVATEIVAASPGDAALAERAAGYFRRAASAAPRNNGIWLAWARFHNARDEGDRAEAVLREAVKARPSESERRLALADLVRTRHGYDAAKAMLVQAIGDEPREMALRFALADLHESARRQADALEVLEEIAEKTDSLPKAIEARTRLAAMHLRAGRTEQAAGLIAEVLKSNPRDNAALLLRARMHLAAGRPRDAVTDLRAVARDQPSSPDVVLLLAQAHRAADEPQLAREVLDEAVQRRPEDGAMRAAVAAHLADLKDFDAALALLDAGIRLMPTQRPLYELKLQILLARDDIASALKTLSDLAAARPGEAFAHVRSGELLQRQGKFDAALREFDAGAAAAPGDLAPLLAATRLLIAQKRFDEAERRVAARLKAEPDNSLVHHLQGDLALARRDWAAAERAYRGAIAAAPKVPAGYINVARTMSARGDAAGALAFLAGSEKALPADRARPLALKRADLLTRERRYDEAIATYEALLAARSDDDLVANNLAYLLAEVKGDKASAEKALAIATRFADSRQPSYLDSLAWAHYRLGQYDKALPLLERAASLAPDSMLVQLHLGKTLFRSGQTERGRELIERAIRSGQPLPGADEARAMAGLG